MAQGTLIPEDFVYHQSSEFEIELASIIWGISLGVSMYTFFVAGKQTFRAWRRARRLTFYMVLMWLGWSASTIMGIISWCFIKSAIQPSLQYFIAISEYIHVPEIW